MNQVEVMSPCIDVCSLNENTGLCLGCFRNVEEIRDWWEMDMSQRKAVLSKLDEREQAVFSDASSS